MCVYIYYTCVCMYAREHVDLRVRAAMTETNKKKTPLIFQRPHNKHGDVYSY